MNRCRDCLAELSPGAAHCPQCGRELGPPVTLPPAPAPQTGTAQSFRIAIIVFVVAGAFAALILIGLLVDPARKDASMPIDQGNVATPSPARTGELVATTAEDLAKAYEENGLAARDRFEGGPIRVTGTLLRVGSNEGEPTISLQSSLPIQAAFADATPLKALKSGQQVTITCEALNEAAAVLYLKSCVVTVVRERANTPDDRRTGPQ